MLSVIEDKLFPSKLPFVNLIVLPEVIEWSNREDKVIVVPTIDVTVVPDGTPEPITKSPTLISVLLFITMVWLEAGVAEEFNVFSVTHTYV